MSKETLLLENVSFMYPSNFSGREGPYNPPGRKNFTVVIEDENLASELLSKGWNVKTKVIKGDSPENDIVANYIQVEVRYGNEIQGLDPKIYLVVKDSNKITLLNEETVGLLDTVDIENIDLEINPSDWGSKKNGVPSIKAYCKTMYVTISSPAFSQKYKQYSEENNLPF